MNRIRGYLCHLDLVVVVVVVDDDGMVVDHGYQEEEQRIPFVHRGEERIAEAHQETQMVASYVEEEIHQGRYYYLRGSYPVVLVLLVVEVRAEEQGQREVSRTSSSVAAEVAS